MSILERLGIIRRQVEGDAADEEGDGATETVRKIVRALDELPPERARYVAAFAYLLGRVAHADLDITEDETREMERIVAERGGLPEEQAVVVVQMAKSQNRLFGGTEDYLVAREFHDIATREEKLALLECLFAVSASDASISSVEDAEIRKIADSLRLEHHDVIAVRARFREHLDVFKAGRDDDSEGSPDV